jgi:hypothetical protein
MNRQQLRERMKKLDRSKVSPEDLAILDAAIKGDTIPKGTYRVKRLSAWLSRVGFDYVINQKFKILEGSFTGREIMVTQELDDSDQLELKEDAEV